MIFQFKFQSYIIRFKPVFYCAIELTSIHKNRARIKPNKRFFIDENYAKLHKKN